MAVAGMALLCIAGICSMVCVPLTLLKHRPQGLPQANQARVALAGVALGAGVIGIILPMVSFPTPAPGVVYGPGLGLSIVAALLCAAHLVLFSREHCACCGAPAPGAAQPQALTSVSVVNSAFKAPVVVAVARPFPQKPEASETLFRAQCSLLPRMRWQGRTSVMLAATDLWTWLRKTP